MYTTPEKTLGVMSIAFLLSSKEDPVIWRGPKKNGMYLYFKSFFSVCLQFEFFLAMIKQFLTDVYWQDIDYLIIDTPPGTSDEHITVMENLRLYI